VPHAPQLFESESSETQLPLQLVSPAPQPAGESPIAPPSPPLPSPACWPSVAVVPSLPPPIVESPFEPPSPMPVD
jgi:hypothetical protein